MFYTTWQGTNFAKRLLGLAELYKTRFFMDNQDKERIIWLRELLKKNAPVVYKRYASYKFYKEYKKDEQQRITKN